MKKLMMMVCIGLLGLGLQSSATGEEAGVWKGTRNDVCFMTGGVSKGERADMEAQSGGYNLKIVLATQEGSYLARLPVTIRNAQGRTVLELETNGPWLYANLPDGRYTVQATHEGAMKDRTVQVDEGLEVVLLHWKS